MRGSSAQRVDQLRRCRKATSFAIDLSLKRFGERSGTGFAIGKPVQPISCLAVTLSVYGWSWDSKESGDGCSPKAATGFANVKGLPPVRPIGEKGVVHDVDFLLLDS